MPGIHRIKLFGVAFGDVYVENAAFKRLCGENKSANASMCGNMRLSILSAYAGKDGEPSCSFKAHATCAYRY